MKRIKILTTILVVAFVVGSSFTTHKFTTEYQGQMSTVTQLTGSLSEWAEVQIVDDAVAGGACFETGSLQCKLVFTNQTLLKLVASSPTSQQRDDNNFIEISANGAIKTVQIKNAGSDQNKVSFTYDSGTSNKEYVY